MKGMYFHLLSLLLVASLWLHVADSADTSCPKTFSGSPGSNATRNYTQCLNLPQLGATLSWTYYPANGSVDLAFRAKPGSSSGWVAWGINPNAKGMLGTQALIALKQSNGTMACNTYNVTSKSSPLVPSPISIPATDLGSEFENGLMTIFAKVVLPSKKSVVNQVWEVGSKAEGLNPSIHAFGNSNLQSFDSIDFSSAKSPSASPSAKSPSPSSSTPSNSSSPTSSGSSSSPSSSNGSITRISVRELFTALLFLGFSVMKFCCI